MSGGQLSPNLGYLQITAFPDEVEQIGSAVDKALDTLGWPRAMVVDVRDNRGGSDRGVKAVADRFADCRRLYQTASIRSGPRWDQFTAPVEWWLEPGGPRQFHGPVVLLVNRDTFSAGETFALAMRVLPHVTIVGEPTAGVFSDAADAALPNGWQLTYSIGVWRDAQGTLWEDRGVQPDITVTASAAGLVDGRDEALDWAIERLAPV
jgi:C-terminal processing protease CtpA/Prc